MTHYAVRIYFWVPELRPIEIHKVFERELLNAQVHFAVLVLMRLHHRMLLSRSYADCDTSTNWLSTQRASFCCQTEKKRAPQVSAFRFLTPSKDMQNTGTALCSLFDWDFASIRYRAVCLCLSVWTWALFCDLVYLLSGKIRWFPVSESHAVYKCAASSSLPDRFNLMQPNRSHPCATQKWSKLNLHIYCPT